MELDIRVACPSYKRPVVRTLLYLPYAKVYVSPEEEAAYQAANPGAAIIACPPGVQGNVSRVRNHILDTEFDDGADAVLIMDDDVRRVCYWERMKQFPVSQRGFPAFMEKHTIMAQDIGARMWGVSVNADKQTYREYQPFSTLSFLGGPFGCFLRGNECRYDESLPLKEDYDMTLQQLSRYRVNLRLNKFFYDCLQSQQAGGCATYRNLDNEAEQFRRLQEKWGSEIVRIDHVDNRSHSKNRKKRVTLDYNPVLRIPIRGV